MSTLSRLDNVDGCCRIEDLFDAYSPNVRSDWCDDYICHIKLVDVLDHTGCNVTYTGNSDQGLLRTEYFNSHLFIRDMSLLEATEPLYVTISCVA